MRRSGVGEDKHSFGSSSMDRDLAFIGPMKRNYVETEEAKQLLLERLKEKYLGQECDQIYENDSSVDISNHKMAWLSLEANTLFLSINL